MIRMLEMKFWLHIKKSATYKTSCVFRVSLIVILAVVSLLMGCGPQTANEPAISNVSPNSEAPKNQAGILLVDDTRVMKRLDAIKNKIEEDGSKIAASEFYAAGTKDFSSALNKLAAAKALTPVYVITLAAERQEIERALTSLKYPADFKYIEVSMAKTVIYESKFDLVSMRLDTSVRDAKKYNPGLSPDGKTIVFEKMTDFGMSRLYLADIDGNNIRPILPITGAGPSYQYPSWSPDGSKIAFCKSRVTPTSAWRWVTHNVWIMNPDGSDMRQITSSTGTGSEVLPLWFPDNERIAFATDESGFWEIRSVSITTLEIKPMARMDVHLYAGEVPRGFMISPDGARIAFSDFWWGEKIYTVNTKNGKISEGWLTDVSDVAPVKSADGLITVFTRPDGLYYLDAFSKEPVKIPWTAAGDIAIRLE